MIIAMGNMSAADPFTARRIKRPVIAETNIKEKLALKTSTNLRNKATTKLRGTSGEVSSTCSWVQPHDSIGEPVPGFWRWTWPRDLKVYAISLMIILSHQSNTRSAVRMMELEATHSKGMVTLRTGKLCMSNRVSRIARISRSNANMYDATAVSTSNGASAGKSMVTFSLTTSTRPPAMPPSWATRPAPGSCCREKPSSENETPSVSTILKVRSTGTFVTPELLFQSPARLSAGAKHGCCPT
mmetsp:Transcript_19747/g.52780  ORF Transcript_19747/g.52780 Transcript_19747/m.52780 type:complete len:242 (+) Transcript_19747:712-1437(+)